MWGIDAQPGLMGAPSMFHLQAAHQHTWGTCRLLWACPPASCGCCIEVPWGPAGIAHGAPARWPLNTALSRHHMQENWGW